VLWLIIVCEVLWRGFYVPGRRAEGGFMCLEERERGWEYVALDSIFDVGFGFYIYIHTLWPDGVFPRE
jgi:hypothetical protein